jgi:hypothetical protein
VTAALAQAGHLDRAVDVATAAEQTACTITDPHRKAAALTEVAGALAQAGHLDRAVDVATAAEQTARTITDPYPQVHDLTEAAWALAKTGQHDQAVGIATAAEKIARTITNAYWKEQAMTEVAAALSQASQHDRTITDRSKKAHVTAMVQAGDDSGACRAAAAVCIAERWTAAVLPALQVQPSVSATVIDLVVDQVRPS